MTSPNRFILPQGDMNFQKKYLLTASYVSHTEGGGGQKEGKKRKKMFINGNDTSNVTFAVATVQTSKFLIFLSLSFYLLSYCV